MPKQSKVSSLRVSKPGTATPAKDDAGRFVCNRCGKVYTKQRNNFSPSYSPLFRGNGGYFSTCCSCMDDLYLHYRTVLDGDANAMRRMCMKYDIYWSPSAFAMVSKANTNNSRFRAYLSKLNLASYHSKTYDDTIDEETIAQEELSEAAEAQRAEDLKRAKEEAAEIQRLIKDQSRQLAEQQAQLEAANLAMDEAQAALADAQAKAAAAEEEANRAYTLPPTSIDPDTGEVILLDTYPVPTSETVRFWGSGYTAENYFHLNERYENWTKDLPKPLDLGAEALYKQLCILEEIINRDTIAGKPVEKSITTYNNLLGSLNEKPIQKKQDEALDADFEQMPFGVGIKLFEDRRPIPKPLPEYQDVDGLIRYISIWFLGHLCHMLNIRNGYSKLYEDEMARLRVERPELDEEDDDALFNDIFMDSAP